MFSHGQKEGFDDAARQRIVRDSGMHKAVRRLFARQITAATPNSGAVDLGVLPDNVVAQYSRALTGDDHAVQFHAVLENMAQGLCLFDGKQRLIVCNHRNAEIYGLSAEHVRPGTTLREIVEQRHLKETTPAMSPAEYLFWRD